MAACAVTMGVTGGGAWWLWPRAAVVAPAAQVPASTPTPISNPAPSPAAETPATSEPAATSKPQGGSRFEPVPAAASEQAGATTLALQIPPIQRPPVFAPPLATEAEILADSPDKLAIYRFDPRPEIIVLQFPNLSSQAQMLNRVAALVEKRGYPHDAVLSRAALNERIVAEGSTPDTFYYGHDYRSADVLHFLDLAPTLDADEQHLREIVQRLGWRPTGTTGAIISIVQASSAVGLDAKGRAAILRHELSHGFYFTDQTYADYCRRFWDDTLTAGEREKFTAFLGKEGYDTALSDLIINETQAYLMHTPDRRFFTAAEVGISPTRIVELRQIFLVGMPPGWLRDHTSVELPP